MQKDILEPISDLVNSLYHTIEYFKTFGKYSKKKGYEIERIANRDWSFKDPHSQIEIVVIPSCDQSESLLSFFRHVYHDKLNEAMEYFKLVFIRELRNLEIHGGDFQKYLRILFANLKQIRQRLEEARSINAHIAVEELIMTIEEYLNKMYAELLDPGMTGNMELRWVSGGEEFATAIIPLVKNRKFSVEGKTEDLEPIYKALWRAIDFRIVKGKNIGNKLPLDTFLRYCRSASGDYNDEMKDKRVKAR